ncbi:MAG TPA: hypothetical protein VJY33_26685 [Isosphaeraceae bacterium]|nr:hypothetical protein [Isosphaeraceae bacterium]
MAIPHAHPGMPVDLRPAEESLSEARTTALVKNNAFEAIRMVIPKGRASAHPKRTQAGQNALFPSSYR